ncbi:FecR family protein [Phenylobacterium sp.]|jgi:transmembrane sensor|uniref:FecR family protein n=1 Tax=Phenylobacterium sp. TaxID=1871053 RepID=UPI002F3E5499
MSETATQRSRAQTEAADWFARQSRLSITTDALYDFREWRKDPANAAAYAAIEATWTAAGGLAEDRDIKAATQAALQPQPARRAAIDPAVRARWLYGVVAALVVAAVGARVLIHPTPAYETRVGEQRLVVLADGSRVRLNTDSRLIVRYRRGERDVELARGEGFFEVAHDPSRPFVVQADGARVRALGTKFDVRRDPDRVRVTLLEGRVQVARTDQAASATLSPNQQLTVTAKGLSPVRAADAAEASGWTSGRLTFHATPLRDAVAEVNRYASRKVVLEGPDALARQPVSGAFNTGDTEAFVSAVQGLFDLQATPAADVIRLGPRPAAPAA